MLVEPPLALALGLFKRKHPQIAAREHINGSLGIAHRYKSIFHANSTTDLFTQEILVILARESLHLFPLMVGATVYLRLISKQVGIGSRIAFRKSFSEWVRKNNLLYRHTRSLIHTNLDVKTTNRIYFLLLVQLPAIRSNGSPKFFTALHSSPQGRKSPLNYRPSLRPFWGGRET